MTDVIVNEWVYKHGTPLNLHSDRDSLRRAHSRARKTLKTAAKRQRRGYGELNRIVRFHRGDWVWRAYPRQGGKL